MCDYEKFSELQASIASLQQSVNKLSQQNESNLRFIEDCIKKYGGGLPGLLDQISLLDPAKDTGMKQLHDIVYKIGMRLNEWDYSLGKVENKVWKTALNTGYSADGLHNELSNVLIDGYGDHH